MKIRLKKLHPNAVIPTYATDGSGAFDLTAISKQGQVYGTGLAFELPKGYHMLILPRSGFAFNDDIRIANCVPFIDNDYRGEVKIKLTYDGHPSSAPFWPHVGERIAQAVILKIPQAEFEEVEELSDTQRGENGFGSSGK